VAREPSDIKKFCYQECFKEDTREWELCHDPHAYEERLRIYGEPVPDFYHLRAGEMAMWRATLRDRAKFEDYEPVLGEPVHDEVKRLRQEYCKDLKQKTADKESWRRDMFDEMMFQLENW
jgi:hypothetical protein